LKIQVENDFPKYHSRARYNQIVNIAAQLINGGDVTT